VVDANLGQVRRLREDRVERVTEIAIVKEVVERLAVRGDRDPVNGRSALIDDACHRHEVLAGDQPITTIYLMQFSITNSLDLTSKQHCQLQCRKSVSGSAGTTIDVDSSGTIKKSDGSSCGIAKSVDTSRNT
jgi:hypothetical protein